MVDISGEYVTTPTAMADRQQRRARMTSMGALVTSAERSDGTTSPAATATDPTFQRTVGAANGASGQNPTSVSPAAALQIVAARAGRQSVTISNITGTQPVFFTTTASTTGATTGFFLAGTVGATVTISTQAAIFATAPTAAQTLSYWENY